MRGSTELQKTSNRADNNNNNNKSETSFLTDVK